MSYLNKNGSEINYSVKNYARDKNIYITVFCEFLQYFFYQLVF